MKNLLLLLLVIVTFSCSSEEKFPDNNKMEKYPYPEEVYGNVFGEIHMMELFPDAKTFTDATPKADVDKIILEFRKRKNDSDFDAKAFVDEYWDVPPLFASDFVSDSTKNLTEHINSLWPILTQSGDKAVKGSTLIPLPKPYIVPGGRYREMHYWDSYFIMLGLKESGREDMITNMLDNFVYLIDEIGHIPNGNRTYFISRSQPPFFAQMVDLYAGIKGEDVYKDFLPAMQTEYDFWMRGHDKVSMKVRRYEHSVCLEENTIINRYFDSHDAPRPEAYRSDSNMGVFKNLRAANESGWNFSSRWLQNRRWLGTIRTLDIFPIDLNALLFGLEQKLEKGYRLTGDTKKADEFKSAQNNRIELLNNYHWSDSLGVFLDYHYEWERPLFNYTPAMMYPLFFKMASKEQADRVVEALKGKLWKAGGVVTSTHETRQRWDAPYGWPPLQWMTLIGLDNYGYKDEALELAKRWTALNEKVYKDTGHMLDKYNVEDLSLEGGGSNNPVPVGFGSSNGVYLAMKKYIRDNE